MNMMCLYRIYAFFMSQLKQIFGQRETTVMSTIDILFVLYNAFFIPIKRRKTSMAFHLLFRFQIRSHVFNVI